MRAFFSVAFMREVYHALISEFHEFSMAAYYPCG
jgi:hypothetical protein